MSLEKLNSVEVGERLRIARETADITQADAATDIDVARTTLVAIEKGQRRIRIDELQRLARLYDMSINALLRRESVHVDLVPRFRKLQKSAEDASTAAAQLLSNLARAEVELENLLGISRTRNYPPERPLVPGNVRAQAEAFLFLHIHAGHR
ncbi:MAG: helix-turn-helix transcriptional regulator, partial [Proteobacteria bacterium]|nr:helix-turn-helix transcriptional regulator [Pseudomonadota bacterium]